VWIREWFLGVGFEGGGEMDFNSRDRDAIVGLLRSLSGFRGREGGASGLGA